MCFLSGRVPTSVLTVSPDKRLRIAVSPLPAQQASASAFPLSVPTWDSIMMTWFPLRFVHNEYPTTSSHWYAICRLVVLYLLADGFSGMNRSVPPYTTSQGSRRNITPAVQLGRSSEELSMQLHQRHTHMHVNHLQKSVSGFVEFPTSQRPLFSRSYFIVLQNDTHECGKGLTST